MKYAAIDIGSNAARLLVADVSSRKGKIRKQKLNLVRIPLRLGFDSFTKKRIPDNKIEEIRNMMIAYKHIMDIYQVEDYFACATSAFREAENGSQVADMIFDETGIRINIIDGSQEAKVIYATQIADQLDADKNYLYIDVGGGSTEITYFENQKMKCSKSFNIGTIRILQNLITDDDWKGLSGWLEENIKDGQIYAIGSGGNINKTHKMSGREPRKPLSLDFLIERLGYLSSYTLNERISVLGLRPDRADVIIPALQIYTFVMRHKNIDRIYAPRIGVADGVVALLFEGTLQQVLEGNGKL